ncbi:MAG: VOC family protein [Candidatus Acidiferrales bacterium]
MRTLIAVTLLLAGIFASHTPQTKKETATMKITTLIYVPAIEPSLKFWVHQLGFTKTVEVPDGDKLSFVILMHGEAELMIQSTASIEKDNAEMAKLARPAACLYIEVSDFDDLIKRLGSAPVVVPVRTTFYGMKEIGVREPGGNIVLFAAPTQPQAATH